MAGGMFLLIASGKPFAQCGKKLGDYTNEFKVCIASIKKGRSVKISP